MSSNLRPLFRIRRDRRTFNNFLKLPFILFVSIPVRVILIAIRYIDEEWLDIIDSKLPGWQTYENKNKGSRRI